MTEEEFEKTIEAVAEVMTSYHQRLERVEKWMLSQDKEKYDASKAL